MIVGHKVKQEAKEEVGEGESMSEDFSSATDKELQKMKEEMLQDAATIVGQEVKQEVEEVVTNTDAVEPAIPPTAKRRRLARWETQRKQAAQTLIEAFVKMDEADELQVSKIRREQGDGEASSFAEGVEGLMFAVEQAPEQVKPIEDTMKEAAPVPNQIPLPRFAEGVKALQDSVPQAPETPATSAKPTLFRRDNSGKQSGVSAVKWNKGCWAWEVNFPLFDKKGKTRGRTNRQFSLSKFMKEGVTETEADAAALEAAKAFRAELVKQGVLKEPKPVDPNFTSEVPGVCWAKARKKWQVLLNPKGKKRIHGGRFTDKAAAESKALELAKLHGLERKVTAVGRFSELPIFEAKVPYPGVTWDQARQQWRAQCQINGTNQHFRVKPKDHSEAELEASHKKAVVWRKKQKKERVKAAKPTRSQKESGFELCQMLGISTAPSISPVQSFWAPADRIVDAWKADALSFGDEWFQRVVLSPVLGRLAATLGGWSGARVAEDQVWIKPPGAGPLVFHRDSPYFDFEPDHVITRLWPITRTGTRLDRPELEGLQLRSSNESWADMTEEVRVCRHKRLDQQRRQASTFYLSTTLRLACHLLEEFKVFFEVKREICREICRAQPLYDAWKEAARYKPGQGDGPTEGVGMASFIAEDPAGYSNMKQWYSMMESDLVMYQEQLKEYEERDAAAETTEQVGQREQ
ncbi:unnamed protein product [Durusdinium trenchii]|uniref:AP2/ERF domain-containing protein n=1 Tax=Durusdinium trenchii TaxID=1381693 RepID=A0ABP0IFM6_9DINO